MTTKYATQIARTLNLPVARVQAAVELLDEGNTLPFIARYRKEVTGGLDEVQIRDVADLLETQRALDDRRATILASIAEQEKLTPELQAQIEAATTRTVLEDLYQPFKPKRRTRAMIARERGLEPLAESILAQPRAGVGAEDLATPYLSDDVATVDDALSGARDIIAERISDHPEIRRVTREKALQWGTAVVGKVSGADDPRRRL